MQTLITPQIRGVSMIANTGVKMRVEHYDQPVVVHLLQLEIPSQRLPLLLAHHRSQCVGQTTRIRVAEHTLIVTGLVTAENEFGRDVLHSGGLGFPWKASIGAKPLELEYLDDGKYHFINGMLLEGPCHIMQKAVLQEISFVDHAADDQTVIRFHRCEDEAKTASCSF